jgi:curli biogenesis system outer membrane secretion channel CsgG
MKIRNQYAINLLLKTTLICLGAFSFAPTMKTNAAEKTRISVTAFTNKASSGACYREYWWSDVLGNAFREMLIDELTKTNQLEILEREHIKTIYSDEHELVNSKNAKKPKKGEFKVAQYTLIGAVSEFEYCAGGGGASVDVGRMVGFGSLRVGGKKSAAKVAVTIRVVDVETGEVVSSVRSVGNNSRTSFDVDAFFDQVDFDAGAFKNTPIGEAARIAIQKASQELMSTKARW